MQERGNKQYEPSRRCEDLREPSSLIPLKTYNNKHLSNHLGNVLVTIQDRKEPIIIGGGPVGSFADLYHPYIVTATDYYAFGSSMEERTFVTSSGVEKYKYGMNTQEKDDEVYGEGNSTSAEFWQYDARLGRRWNVDPKPNISISAYSCFGNNPISFVDIIGDTAAVFKPDGSFWKFEEDGKEKWVGKFYQDSKVKETKTADGVTTTTYEYSNPLSFQFNDPDVDVLAIKNGVNSNGTVGITRIEVMSDALVEAQIDRSGVKNVPLSQSIQYALEEGEKKLDYGVQGIQSGDLNPKTFYIRGKTAYNVGDIGNYLFGRGMNELRVSIATSLIGAQYNNMENGKKQKTPLYDFGPGTYGEPGFFDSWGDQKAITRGHLGGNNILMVY